MSDIKLHEDHLEHRANLLRQRLTRTLEELDRRRRSAQQMVSVKTQAQRHPEVLLAGGALAMLAIGGGILAAVLGIRGREERLRKERVAALQRMWWQPQYVARKKRGVLASIGRGVIVSVSVSAGAWGLRKAARYALLTAAQRYQIAPGRVPLALPEGEVVPRHEVMDGPPSHDED
ncbi:hypothetical protein [Chondromyces crocatus]|uniref:Uncharacterized protein n=1 Tax=Chondromyces crocatus TaxID=52 RepID=A0A0K1E7E0_CHOCO|nr:hypothetical protein [Chondromyces crocatus]AKT36780.1 uncharacterized protein CMC5_009010 [Chondromyces crocatus]